MSRARRWWTTLCLHEHALHVSEVELRADLGRWLPRVTVWLPGAERGRLSPVHPYALFAFVPAGCNVAAVRRCRFVEQVIAEPVPDGELRRSLQRVGHIRVGAMVRVVEGAMAGAEGCVVRALRQALLLRIALVSGDRTVWVRRWEVGPV
jgi:hypothetical protein